MGGRRGAVGARRRGRDRPATAPASRVAPTLVLLAACGPDPGRTLPPDHPRPARARLEQCTVDRLREGAARHGPAGDARRARSRIGRPRRSRLGRLDRVPRRAPCSRAVSRLRRARHRPPVPAADLRQGVASVARRLPGRPEYARARRGAAPFVTALRRCGHPRRHRSARCRVRAGSAPLRRGAAATGPRPRHRADVSDVPGSGGPPRQALPPTPSDGPDPSRHRSTAIRSAVPPSWTAGRTAPTTCGSTSSTTPATSCPKRSPSESSPRSSNTSPEPVAAMPELPDVEGYRTPARRSPRRRGHTTGGGAR